MCQASHAARSVAPTDLAPPASGGVELRRMGLQDLAFVVAAHQEHFGEGFFARLGPRFLSRYYRTFLDGPSAVAVIAERAGTRCGYLTGVLDTRLHRNLLLRYHGPALALRGGVAMVHHPRLALIFVGTRVPRYLRAVKRGLALQRGPAGKGSAGRVAVLTHVVVDESRQRQGVGAQLVTRFLCEAATAGCATAVLLTAADPTGAAGFYQAHGWTRDGDVTTREGRRLWRYTVSIQPRPCCGVTIDGVQGPR